MKNSEKREIWARRVQEWRASGLSAPEFGKRHGVSAARLYNWASSLKLQRDRQHDAPFPFVRVMRRGAVANVTGPERPIVVEIAAARVVLSKGFNKEALADVIAILSTHDKRGQP